MRPMMATTTGVCDSSIIACQSASLMRSCQIHQHRSSTSMRRSLGFLAFRRHGFPGQLYASLPRLSCPVRDRISVVRIRRVGFGAVGWRPFSSGEPGRLGFGKKTAVVGAQEEDKEHQELDKVAENYRPESWASSVQRANVVSRIVMSTFVWISVFFGISVANNEMGGGRPGRRGPRK